MNKKNSISLFFVLLGIALVFSFLIIGSEVDKDGFLQEPFYLYGTGIFSILIGVSVFILSHIISFVRKSYER